MLDIAREQVADAPPAGSTDAGTSGGGGPDRTAPGDAAAPIELPAPDPSSFEGAHRVVNLFVETVDGDVGSGAIDVWARRTFTNGPVLLAADVAFGQTTDDFAAPRGADVVIVGAGAGPDGEERAATPAAVGDEAITIVFTNAVDGGGATVKRLEATGDTSAPGAPGDEIGRLVVVAANLRAFGDELRASVGSDDYTIGDGTGACRPQSDESSGAVADVLGSAAQIELDVAPGAAVISLHPAFAPPNCDEPPVVETTIDVAAGRTTTLIVYTADGVGLSTLVLPDQP